MPRSRQRPPISAARRSSWTLVFEPKAGLQDYRQFSDGGQVKLSYCAEGTSPEQVQQAIETVSSVLARSGAEGQWRITVVPPGGDETETVWAAQ